MKYVGNLTLLAAVFSVLLHPFFIAAQTAEDIRSQISSHQAQLDALNKEIAQYEKELAGVGAKKQTLQSAVNSLDLSVKRTQTKIRAIQNQIATTELEIKELSGDIVSKEEAMSIDAAAIAETIRNLHEAQSASLVELVLANQSVSEMWDDTEATINIQDSMHKHVESLQVAKVELTEDRDAEEKKRAQLVGQRTDLRSEEQSLAVQKREQQELLSVTKSQESSYQALLSQKQAAKATFESALSDLESKLQYTLDPSKLPPVGKGILRWPLDNIHVTQQFGRTADAKRLYASGTHNGVDFRAPVGTPVKAALSGAIQGTGNSDAVRGCYSYGKWVLIKHANGLTTLYAHLSQINVSQGESVSTGEVIGFAGATGYATGPHLHFTVYASNAVQVRMLGTNTPCGKATIPVSAASGYLNPMDYL